MLDIATKIVESLEIAKNHLRLNSYITRDISKIDKVKICIFVRFVLVYKCIKFFLSHTRHKRTYLIFDMRHRARK